MPVNPKYKGPLALFGLCCLLIFLTVCLVSGFYSTPVFFSLTGISFGVLFPGRSWASIENENLMWAFLWSSVVTAALFSYDSPVCFARYYPACGVFSIVGVFLWGYHYDRSLSYAKLKAKPWGLVSMDPSRMLNGEGHEKVLRIKKLADGLNVGFVALKALKQKSLIEAEKEIINIFKEANYMELNYICTNVPLAHIFHTVKDRKGTPHRTTLLQLVCKFRLPDLGVPARQFLLDSIQTLRLTAHPSLPEYTRDIFLNTYGDELTRLKNGLDNKGGAENLHALLYYQIEDERIRSAIIAHFLTQSCVHRNQTETNAPFEKLLGQTLLKPARRMQKSHSLSSLPSMATVLNSNAGRCRKILSDIDDTLFSSGGKWPAGIDQAFPKHFLYPGVLQFYKELEIGKGPGHDTGEFPEGEAGNLVFLSARPHVYKDKTEAGSFETFKHLIDDFGLHCMPTLLAGDLVSSTYSVFQNDFEPMAKQKFVKFDQYASCYPEAAFVFIGDNGQGDVLAATMMKVKWGNSVDACFIHDVSNQPDRKALTESDPNHPSNIRKASFVCFTTYIGAALEAAKMQLIDPKGILRVAARAKQDIMTVEPKTLLTYQRLKEINDDIRSANYWIKEFWDEEVTIDLMVP